MQTIILLFLLVITTEVFAEKLAPLFAEKMLAPPVARARPECHHSYENAPQPKTANHILASMTPICLNKGGLRIIHRILFFGYSTEFSGLMLTCIGETPNYIIFNCLFPTSYEYLLKD